MQRMQRAEATVLPYWRIGMIFRGTLCRPAVAGPPPRVGFGQIINTNYGQVFARERPFIVVATNEEHAIALPMYTREGNGLRGVRNREEYVSVLDPWANNNHEPQSHWPPLTAAHLEPAERPWPVTSCVHFTYHVSVSYGVPIVYMGDLTPDSTWQLLALYLHHCPQLP